MIHYHRLSDSELIRHCDNIKGASPLIDELVRRFDEAQGPNQGVHEEKGHSCPICEAPLLIDVEIERIDLGVTKVRVNK